MYGCKILKLCCRIRFIGIDSIKNLGLKETILKPLKIGFQPEKE